MKNNVINEKIESLRKCLVRLEDKKPDDIAILRTDIDRQDIISVNLERAIQICVDIASYIISSQNLPAPTTMSESIAALEKVALISTKTSLSLQKAVGFRNISVHAYKKIDWDIVFSILHNHLNDFKAFVREIEENRKT
ncbi:MAG: DUF86 domain-containing protein [Pseudobdellovibrionaceae bacterium]|nr:DUF86 domain-containing protein [Bdellovibrionales bacterium]USN48616.1 MAG: DUF86 domain-containing protein [Pseudobdellovibrionaceae bacterium]